MADHAVLVAALEDLGRELRHAPVRDLAPAVVDRIFASPPTAVPRVEERRRVVLLAAAVVLVVLALVTAVRPTREAIADFLGIGDTQVRTVDELDLPDDVAVDLGQHVELRDVTSDAGFAPVVPDALGQPDAVYFRTVAGYPQVAQVWAAPPGDSTLPALTGAETLLTETPTAGREIAMFVKEVGRSTRVQRVVLNGREALWIEGTHVRFGADEPRRAAANTLLWTDDELIYRLETTRGLQDAQATARSLR
jgi:hypothetical protein